VNHLDHLLPVLLGTAGVALQTGTSEDGGAGEGGSGEGRAVRGGSERVEDIVWKKEEESLGGGSL